MRSLSFFISAVLIIGLFTTSGAVNLQKTGDYTYSTVIEIPEYAINRMGNGYLYLKAGGGFLPDGEVGKPALPVKMFRLAIGKNKVNPQVQTKILETEQIALASKLHPLQQDWPVSRDISERPFRIDAGYYATQGKRAPLVTVSETFVCHGVPGVEITLHPFAYNPRENLLTVVRKFKVTIHMPEGISAIPALSSKTSHAYVKHMFCNYYVPMRSTMKKENYLIIAAPEFEDNAALDSFVTFREETYNVSKVSTDDAGNTTSQIESYLKELYNGEGLTYVLFVGNKGNLPYYTSGPASFWQYGLIEGDDNYTDVHVGVFCVRNATSLGNIVHKTIHTDRNIKDYPDTTTIYSTFEHEHMVMQCSYIRNNCWEPGGWAISWMVPDPSGSENFTSALRKQINSNNTRFVSYEGHGSSSGWQDGLNQSDVRNMTNTEVYPFVWGYACSNGTFQNSSECFAETWIGAECGGVMFTGASVTSSSYQKALNVGMARGASLEDLYTIGQVFDYGKTFVYDSTESIEDEMQFVATVEKESGSKMYNLFGDPACLIKYDPTGISDMSIPSMAAGQLSISRITANTIVLTIPGKGRYDIVVFSADGKMVQVIASKKAMQAGNQEVPWNGALLAGGVYITRIYGRKREAVEKFVCVK